ncbi:metal ABC transporter substrate-binding protein [Actinomadura scrupuli]|uniref:metal ABC transporter substrate-binding protein n=1 Tax=Actinomadura scrupuli TaxID=559629 RepID=UPI003D978EA0
MFSTRGLIPGALLTLLLACTAACGGSGAAASGKPQVIGSFYPLAWLAERVGGGNAAVTTLTKPGTEPHDLELTPRQIVDVGKARLVVYLKDLQPAVDQAVAEHARTSSLDAASLVKTLPAAGTEQRPGHHDPHLWLDPSRLATVATTLGERLARIDPAHATAYRANARTLTGELTALDGEFRAGLATCTQKTIVTSHAAFGYLAERYGLTQVPVSGIDPEAEPSPKRLAELTRQIRRTGVTTVFTETLVSPKVAQTLAQEAGVRTATLDPIEGLPQGSRDDYASVMRHNLTTLRTALDCS